MKPTKTAAEVLITEDRNYPKGLYAFVDYDLEDRSQYRKLKWFCEDARWQAVLNATVSAIDPSLHLHHYPLDHPNPPRHAALVVEEAFGIKILSEGITRRTGVRDDSYEEEERRQNLEQDDE